MTRSLVFITCCARALLCVYACVCVSTSVSFGYHVVFLVPMSKFTASISGANPSTFSVHAVAGLLKQYLRELPNSLITSSIYDTIVEVISKSTSFQLQEQRSCLLASSHHTILWSLSVFYHLPLSIGSSSLLIDSTTLQNYIFVSRYWCDCGGT